MNKVKNQLRGRASLVLTALVALGLHSITGWSNAQIIPLHDANSTAIIDVSSQNGMFHWDVQGQNELYQQWFWYGVGNGPVFSIDTISAPTVTIIGLNELKTSYTSAGNFDVSVTYTLTGGAVVAPGQHAIADIGEAIRIDNLSLVVLPFHFYQYSYFNLQGASFDVAQLSQNFQGLYNEAVQFNDNVALNETVTAPGANHGEVAPVGQTLAKLNSGGPVVLGPPFFAGPLGPGAVTYAFEWDLQIAPGGSAIISKDKYLDVLIPEPSALALIPLGLIAYLVQRRRQSD